MPCFPNILSSLRLFICAWIGSRLLEQSTREPFLWRKLTLPTPATFKCQSASFVHYWHFDWLDLVQATRATEFISAMDPLCLHNACLEGILPNFRFSSSFALFHNVSRVGRMCDRKVPFQVALHSSLFSALWPAVSFYIHHHAPMGLEIMLFIPMSV